MHNQFYHTEDEFEPRITPKPMTRFDCFPVPSVPEVSLIFEKPIAKSLNNKNTNSSPVGSEKSVSSDKTIKDISSISSDKHNTYAAWKEQNYYRTNNSLKTDISPSCKHIYKYNHVPQLDLEDTMQKQQEHDKICDRPNRSLNAKHNDGMYERNVKFKFPNIEDFCDDKREIQSSDKKHLLSYNSLQNATCNLPNHAMKIPNITDAGVKKNEHQIPYTGYPYSFQQFYPSNYSNYDIDNKETVKTLLQLVNSQNEQIKTLQLQVDRLVRMQEENLRNKSTCMCSSHMNQIFGYPPINHYDTTNTNDSSCVQFHDQDMQENVGHNAPVLEKRDIENFNKNRDNNKLEIALLEQQSKKAFMEQKVSIGVMTSFEFSVQNNPFLMDSEIYEGKENPGESRNIGARNTTNMHDTADSVKRYKNTFTRKPAAQLENIVEDTESYLSSSQQQSSNFNASSCIRDSERHTSKQSDLYNINDLESPKTCQNPTTNLTQEKTYEKMYIGRNDSMDKQVENIRESSINIEYDFNKNMKCGKTHVVNNTNDTTSRKEINDRTNTREYPLHNVHLPKANYYQNHGHRERANVETKDVGDSIVLSGGDFKILERPPPTPEPSIHVEMQEYTSDDESDKLKRTSKIGWTFYNNVLGQVNEILQNSSIINDKDQNDPKLTREVEQKDNTETRTALNTVKAVTLEQLRKLGISITENNENKEPNSNKTMDFDSSFYPRLDYQANMMQTTSVVNETNTSMHMRALALKYLSDEQLADIALQKQGSSSLKHFMLSNMQGTNMSFATMRYLERYQLLPGRNNVQTEYTDQIHEEIVAKHDFKPTTKKDNTTPHRLPFVQTPGTTCPSRILDISTLKRQPKLL